MSKTVTLTLDQLAAAGLKIEQHSNGWYIEGKGPFESAEAAVIAGIERLNKLFLRYRALWEGDLNPDIGSDIESRPV